MAKVIKEEIIRVIKELKDKGHSPEELAVMLGRSHQTIWAWGSLASNRVPCKGEYEVLKRLTIKK
jgi:hypothetical protein